MEVSPSSKIGNKNQLSYVLLSKKGRLSKTISGVLLAHKINISSKRLPMLYLEGMEVSPLSKIGNKNQLSYVLLSKKGRLSKAISDVLLAHKINISSKRLPMLYLEGMKVSPLSKIGNKNQLSYVLLSKKGRLSKAISDVLLAHKINVSSKRLPMLYLEGMEVSPSSKIGNKNQLSYVLLSKKGRLSKAISDVLLAHKINVSSKRLPMLYLEGMEVSPLSKIGNKN